MDNRFMGMSDAELYEYATGSHGRVFKRIFKPEVDIKAEAAKISKKLEEILKMIQG